MRFFYDNQFDDEDFTLTTNSEDSSYPIEYARDYQLSRKYWTEGDSDEWIKIDGGASEAITASMAYIAGHNLSSGATVIKIQGNDTDSWGAPTVDQSFVFASGVIWKVFTEDDLRYWRFQFADAANPDTILKFGRFGLGTYFDLAYWPSKVFPRKPIDTSVKTFSVTGQGYGDERVVRREYEFTFPYITNADRINLETMYGVVKRVKPIVMIFDPSDATIEPFYCSISDFKINHIFGYQWSGSMTLTEEL